MRFSRLIVLVIGAGLWAAAALRRGRRCQAGRGQGRAQVSFYRDIRPLFQDRCQGCHQPAKQLGGLAMTSYARDQKRGRERRSRDSCLASPMKANCCRRFCPAAIEPPAMPKGAAPLKPDQVELIRRWIAEGATDDTPEAAEIAVDRDHPPVYAAPPVLTSLDYSPDGSLLAVSGYHEVLLHIVRDGSGHGRGRLVGLSRAIESARFSPDGKRLAVTGGSPGRFGEVQIWDVGTRELKQSMLVTYDTIYGASWSADGTKVAFGCADNTCRAIEAATGKQVFFQGAHNDWVLDTVFSVDGSHLISVSRDRSMKLNEVATERFVDNVTSITPGASKGA